MMPEKDAPAVVRSNNLALFAPSELVVLHEAAFLPEDGAWAARRAALGAEVELSAHEAQFRQMAFIAQQRALTLAVVRVALLAAEQAGSLRLALETRRDWWGMRRRPTVLATAGPATYWPAHSVEAHLAQLGPQRPCEVQTLVYQLLRRAAAYPWLLVPLLVQDGLVARGLLTTRPIRPLPLVTVRVVSVPETTAALAAQQPLAPLQELLHTSQTQRTALWECLEAQIATGVGRRRAIDAG